MEVIIKEIGDLFRDVVGAKKKEVKEKTEKTKKSRSYDTFGVNDIVKVVKRFTNTLWEVLPFKGIIDSIRDEKPTVTPEDYDRFIRDIRETRRAEKQRTMSNSYSTNSGSYSSNSDGQIEINVNGNNVTISGGQSNGGGVGTVSGGLSGGLQFRDPSRTVTMNTGTATQIGFIYDRVGTKIYPGNKVYVGNTIGEVIDVDSHKDAAAILHDGRVSTIRSYKLLFAAK